MQRMWFSVKSLLEGMASITENIQGGWEVSRH